MEIRELLVGMLRETVVSSGENTLPFTAIGRSVYDWSWAIRALESKYFLQQRVDHQVELQKMLVGITTEFHQRNWREVIMIHPQAAVIDLAGLIMVLQQHNLPADIIGGETNVLDLFSKALLSAAESRQPDLVGYEILMPLMLFNIYQNSPDIIPFEVYTHICSKWEQGVNKLLYLIKKTGTIFPVGVPTTFSAEMLPLITSLNSGSQVLLCQRDFPDLFNKTTMLQQFVLKNHDLLLSTLADKSSDTAGISGSPAASAAFLLAANDSKTTHLDAEDKIVRYLTAIISQDEHRGQPPFTPYSNFSFAWQLLPWLMEADLPSLFDTADLSLRQELIDIISHKLSQTGFLLGWDKAIETPDIDDTAAFFALRVVVKQLGEDLDIPEFKEIELCPLDVFKNFETPEGYVCYPNQVGSSLSHMVHFLLAIYTAGDSKYYSSATEQAQLTHMFEKVMRQMVDQHRSLDTFISEKWHTSQYYPISRLMSMPQLYLESSEEYLPFAELSDHFAETMLLEQHSNGSWGKIGGTLEETAYAIISLNAYVKYRADYSPEKAARIKKAIARGGIYIEEHFMDFSKHNPNMWIVKSLYTPYLVVISHINYALQVAQQYQML